jgi:hypothetical protein
VNFEKYRETLRSTVILTAAVQRDCGRLKIGQQRQSAPMARSKVSETFTRKRGPITNWPAGYNPAPRGINHLPEVSGEDKVLSHDLCGDQ